MKAEIQIKCGNIDCGVYLLDDIKDRLNERNLNGSMVTIDEITSDGLTWITIHLNFIRDDFSPDMVVNPMKSYILGLVAGILIWSGVEVI